MKTQHIWNYKGVTVFPASLNSSGIRWCASSIEIRWCALRPGNITLRSDTKQGMRELIRNEYGKR